MGYIKISSECLQDNLNVQLGKTCRKMTTVNKSISRKFVSEAAVFWGASDDLYGSLQYLLKFPSKQSAA